MAKSLLDSVIIPELELSKGKQDSMETSASLSDKALLASNCSTICTTPVKDVTSNKDLRGMPAGGISNVPNYEMVVSLLSERTFSELTSSNVSLKSDCNEQESDSDFKRNTPSTVQTLLPSPERYTTSNVLYLVIVDLLVADRI